VLQALHRLSPREVPEAIDEIDPLQRGGLIHKIQFTFLRSEPLPVSDLAAAQRRLEAVIDRLAAEARDDLAPAIERVWDDCITGIRIDLRRWLELLAEEKTWTPWRFELAFGLSDGAEERDLDSRKEPVALDEGITLRGSIDLVEEAGGSLRATDYKTGKVWAEPGVVIGGGGTLQPALYALALEKLFPDRKVTGGRLYYCTYVGDFTAREVPLDGAARGSVAELAKTVSAAISQGFLPAAPRDDRECTRCDYQAVCGPNEWQRVKRKPKDELVPLVKLREMP
jgi:CRISPR/Cas system-associated exonuclease Cas4 (RecB family)